MTTQILEPTHLSMSSTRVLAAVDYCGGALRSRTEGEELGGHFVRQVFHRLQISKLFLLLQDYGRILAGIIGVRGADIFVSIWAGFLVRSPNRRKPEND